MEKFFTKKRVIIISIATVCVIILAVLIGIGISKKQANNKVAEQAKMQKTISEKKEKIADIGKQKEIIKKSEEDLAKDNYTEEYKKYEKLTDEEKKKQEVIPRKEKVDYKELDKIIEDQKEDLDKEYIYEEDKEKDENKNKDNVEVIPSKFDLRDKIEIKVEDQNPYGLCWSYATLSSLETNLALTKGVDYDFSEGHMDYMLSNKMSYSYRETGEGGNFEMAMEYANLNNGFVLGKDIPTGDYDKFDYYTFYNTPSVDISITKVARFPGFNAYQYSENERDAEFKKFQAAIKTHIMNYGGLYATIESPDDGNCYYADELDVYNYSRGGHAITIIGWDDNYSRYNMPSPSGKYPSKDGAYLALNSWGDYWYDMDGYFYISYEDCRVNSEFAGIVSTDINDFINIDKIEDDVVKDIILTQLSEYVVNKNGTRYIREDCLSLYKLDLSNKNLKSINFDTIAKYFGQFDAIDLSNNELTSVEGIDKVVKKDGLGSMVAVDLSNNNLKDVSYLEDSGIKILYLDGMENISGYGKIKDLQSISLKNCNLENIEEFENTEYLDSLDLTGNHISDLSTLSNLYGMYEIILSDNDLESLDILSQIVENEGICTIDVSNNNLKNIDVIRNSSICALNLSGNSEIEDYSPVKECPYLTYLNVSNCNIKNVEDIKVSFEAFEFEYDFDYDYEDFYFGNRYGDSEDSEDFDDYSDMDDIYYDNIYKEVYGVTYVLSGNTELTNLNCLDNAVELKLRNCNLEDISELSEIEYLKILDVYDNPNICGDLNNKNLTRLVSNNSNIVENNLLNVGSVDILELTDIDMNGEDVKGLVDRTGCGSLHVSKVDDIEICKTGVYVEAETFDITIEIPSNRNTYLSRYDLYKKCNLAFGNVTVDGKVYGMINNYIPVSEGTVLETSIIEPIGCYNGKIRFKVNPDMENDEIRVTRKPNKDTYVANDTINNDGMKVYNVYANGIQMETLDYSVGDITPISMEKASVAVTQGSLRTKFYVNVSGVDEEILNEDLIVPDDFDEEFPMLTFETVEMYEIAKDYWMDFIVDYNDEAKWIMLSGIAEENGSGFPMYIPRNFLYDTKGLSPVIVTDIYILMNEFDGNERIEESDLEYLKEFPRLQVIHIVTDKTNVSEIIVDQDMYSIEITEGVG